MHKPLKALMMHLPQRGCVEWIGVRPARGEPMRSLQSVMVELGKGLIGDRFKGRAESARQVTLIQYEHLPVIAGCLHRKELLPELLRRNIVVSGINLLALKDKRFQVGEAVLEFRGLCHPCSKMEKALGEGGYNAMRGHGGIVASVIQAGKVNLKDKVVSVGGVAESP
ncbi:MAG: MOSC domain-containing protein [Candidatus Thiodiazotropha lotti]|uniref:MOSC domain-containing protein n=1 Tax=Candidatus Thiodiazotropha lotti TaxID=2792787 RepID=A0A9E4K835_9GAMM|nr:MOSC domain-containing protein [Candidatus Thiodiazotropha lotti]MCG8009728.1 MOSC domain-containing protein [Candidatus Thiodiazotropha lotti]MCW4197321.1 MOSC domain-containing protein [Candidatus Thiodiazotropha lotti]MCW4205042.1 MOSC domain-containing protein [Candidatus Thiodiazotropha lotti]